jgi:hypothetical protein
MTKDTPSATMKLNLTNGPCLRHGSLYDVNEEPLGFFLDFVGFFSRRALKKKRREMPLTTHKRPFSLLLHFNK